MCPMSITVLDLLHLILHICVKGLDYDDKQRNTTPNALTERFARKPQSYLPGFLRAPAANAAQQAMGQVLVQAVCASVGQRLAEGRAGQQLQHGENQDGTQPGRQLSLLTH